MSMMLVISMAGFVLILVAFFLGPILEYHFEDKSRKQLLTAAILFVLSILFLLLASHSERLVTFWVVLGEILGAIGMIVILVACATLSLKNGNE